MENSDEYVSDAEREQVVASLRDHLLAGRLTLQEFSGRVETAYGARVGRELTAAEKGLPKVGSTLAAGFRRKPTRLTVSAFGAMARRGRLRLRRWTVVAGVFADVDLDLREAELEDTKSVVTVVLMFGNADIYVPEGIQVVTGGLSVFGHRRDWGRDASRSDAPIIRVRAISIFGTVDVWRVPQELQGGYGDIIRELEGRQRQLPA